MTGEVVPEEEPAETVVPDVVDPEVTVPDVTVPEDGDGVEEAVGAEEVCAVLPAETTTDEVVCWVSALVSDVAGAVGAVCVSDVTGAGEV